MNTLRNITNTYCELEIAKHRLNWLMDKKERLYTKYFPITSQIKEDIVDGGVKNNDKMADYVAELHELDIGTGRSLAQEIIHEQNQINNLQRYLDKMGDTLLKMKGIEYELYYAIIFEGKNITKAVEEVAEKNNKDVQTVWKYHYRKIKKEILKTTVNVQ